MKTLASLLFIGVLLVAGDARAQDYQSLCVDTGLADTPECWELKVAEREHERVRSMWHWGTSPGKACAGRAEAPLCRQLNEAGKRRQAAWAAVEAKAAQARTVEIGPRDTELPVIKVTAPEQVDLKDKIFRISGLVGDDGSPPRLKVNGEPVPLFRPSAADPKIAEHTLAFNVEMSAREPGEQRVVVEACDASGNCVAEQIVVRVVGTPEVLIY